MPQADAISSRIEQVTVFASGARVRRVATLRAPVPDRVRIADLPLAVIDDTVRVEVAGGAVATAVRPGFTTPEGESAPEESAELRAARLRQTLAKSEAQRLELAIDRLVHAKVVVEDPSDEAPAAWDAVAMARRELVTMRAQRQLALREQLVTAHREVEAADRAFQVAAEREQRTGTARAAKAHEQRKHVELDLVAHAGTGDVTIHLEYQVAAARWAPSYVARLENDGARFELRAVVAQNSGEDWTGVALRLSTAEPDRFSALPELHPQKIGRRQAEPAKRGFRAPPAGAGALFADYLRTFPERRRIIASDFDDSTYEGRVPAPAEPVTPPIGQVWDESSSRSKNAYPEPPGSAPPPPLRSIPAGAPMPMPMSAARNSSVAGGIAGAAPYGMAAQSIAKKSDSYEGARGSRERASDRPEAAPQEPTPRLDYGNLRMGAPESGQRGKLVPAPRAVDDNSARRVVDAFAALTQLSLPPGHHASWAHTYDYAFASDGVVDVTSDGAWHSLALTARPGTAKIRHVAVPREQPDVFRVAHITNPFDGPLLPGPIDVYDRGQFLVTSEVEYTPSGAGVDIGLGVDATVKIARNTEFHEEAAGMLRGALRLVHAITVEIENLSQRAIDLEVRERVPVKRDGDDDIEVTFAKIEPAWERWTPDPEAPVHARLRGAYRWRVEVAPRAKKLLRAGYEVKIAGKNELVGGNRREP